MKMIKDKNNTHEIYNKYTEVFLPAIIFLLLAIFAMFFNL